MSRAPSASRGKRRTNGSGPGPTACTAATLNGGLRKRGSGDREDGVWRLEDSARPHLELKGAFRRGRHVETFDDRASLMEEPPPSGPLIAQLGEALFGPGGGEVDGRDLARCPFPAGGLG